jgi:hypothetical protein
MTASPTSSPITDAQIAAVADKIANALRPKVPDPLVLEVEHNERMSRVVLRHRDDAEIWHPVALVDHGGICLRGPNGTLLRSARSLRKVDGMVTKLAETMPRHVAQVKTALATGIAWQFSADVTERLRRFRAAGPEDDGPALPFTIAAHTAGTEIHICVPNARIGAIASQLEAQLKALAELIVPAPIPAEVDLDDAKLPLPHNAERNWTLLYEDDDGERRLLGRIRHRGPKSEATTRLMELYWEDRLDGVGCSPVVLEAGATEDEDGHETVAADGR